MANQWVMRPGYIQKLGSGLVLYSVKVFSLVFYKNKTTWITPKGQIEWEAIRLAVILNHTSLFEPLFISSIPNKRIWRAIDRVVVPVADVTLQRPIVGWLFRMLAPNAVPITRKRDDSWSDFLKRASGDALVLIFPEGRMMRKGGLDKNGKPMSIKGGVAEILSLIDSGKMLIGYSRGLHHVQAPGEWFIRPFKKIEITFEQIDIQEYKKRLASSPNLDFRASVISDLESRKKQFVN